MEEVVIGFVKLVVTLIIIVLALVASYFVAQFLLSLLHTPPSTHARWGAIILSIYLVGWPSIQSSMALMTMDSSETKH